MISPEVLGLIVASMALGAPIALALKWVRRDRQMVILSVILTTTVPLMYILMISNYSFRDAPRLGLFLLPMVVAFSLTILVKEINEYNFSTLVIFCIPAVLFLWIFAFLILRVGEIYFYYSYGIPQYLNWTINIIVPQLVIYILVISLMSVKRVAGISVRAPIGKLEKMIHLSFPKILYSTLIIAMILQNMYVFTYCFSNSSFFGQGHGLEDTNSFLESANVSSLVFSNTYIYIRNYVSDKVLAEGQLFPPPKTENEFLQLLEFAPDGSLIFISNDSEVAWLEDANNYIKEYVGREIILSNTSEAYAIRIKNEQYSTIQTSLFRIVNSPTSIGGSNRIVVNDARLVNLHNQEKVLELSIFSNASGYVRTIIGTDHFIELCNTTLSAGNNVLRLGGGTSWQYLTKVRVLVEDQKGNIIFEGDVQMFNVVNIHLYCTLIFISVILGVLFLIRRSEPMRVRAQPMQREIATDLKQSKRQCRTKNHYQNDDWL